MSKNKLLILLKEKENILEILKNDIKNINLDIKSIKNDINKIESIIDLSEYTEINIDFFNYH